MEAWVSLEDMALAEYYLRLHFSIERVVRTFRTPVLQTVRGVRKFERIPGLKDVYSRVVSDKVVDIVKLSGYINEFNEYCINKYYHVAYASSLPFLRSIAYVFVANPPQITTLKQFVIQPGSYINIHFIPVLSEKTRHRTVLSKFVYSRWRTPLRYRYRDLFQKLPKLHDIFNNSFNKYVAGGKSKGRAWRLAIRDVFRVLIGNIWLIQIHYLLETNTVTPDDIVLPYEIAKYPLLSSTNYVNPVDVIYDPSMCRELLSEISNITWRSLINRVGLRIEKWM